MPAVSVIITVLNGAATVGRAIDSALDQSFRDFDVIVVDDGSTDRTAQVLAGYGDCIRVITRVNRGLAASRNEAAGASQSRYLAFLDADDSWYREKLALTVESLEASPDAVLAFSNAIPVDANGNALSRSSIIARHAHAPSMEDLMAARLVILPSATVVRRDAFDAVGGFDEKFRGLGFEDFYFYLLMRERGPFVYVPQILVRYTAIAMEQRSAKYGPGYRVFKDLVIERYGDGGRRLIRAFRRSRANTWAHFGIAAMHRGDMPAARRALLHALRLRPRPKTTLRLMRTFLPPRLASALSAPGRAQS
jgi:glycosyltransferase involved in cell wall biosynthesis